MSWVTSTSRKFQVSPFGAFWEGKYILYILKRTSSFTAAVTCSGQVEGNAGERRSPSVFFEWERRAPSSDGRFHVTQKLNHAERCEILKNRQALQVCRVFRSKIFFSFRGGGEGFALTRWELRPPDPYCRLALRARHTVSLQFYNLTTVYMPMKYSSVGIFELEVWTPYILRDVITSDNFYRASA